MVAALKLALLYGPAALFLGLVLAISAHAATRPHYGGTLRVEIRESFDSPDSPQAQRRLSALAPGFVLSSWEAGRRAVYNAGENAAGGRPFLDAIEIEMGRPPREQLIDLGLGKADVIELGPDEIRRQSPGRRLWSSAPVRVMVLVFQSRVDDARIREALALAVDRPAIQNVLLQRQGEVSGALLPQWLSGYAFLFTASADAAKARALVAGIAAPARRITLAVDDPTAQPIAERIVLNARDVGLALAIVPRGSPADARLLEARVTSTDPARALASLAAAIGLPEPPQTNSPEALYAAESTLLEGFRVVPLFHLPDVYGAGVRVRGGPGITSLGEWRFQDLWVEGNRP